MTRIRTVISLLFGLTLVVARTMLGQEFLSPALGHPMIARSHTTASTFQGQPYLADNDGWPLGVKGALVGGFLGGVAGVLVSSAGCESPNCKRSSAKWKAAAAGAAIGAAIGVTVQLLHSVISRRESMCDSLDAPVGAAASRLLPIGAIQSRSHPRCE
jgi:hypothetical protein